MKKNILLLYFIAFPLTMAIAQKSYWVAGVGYGLPSSPRTLFVQQDLRYGGYDVSNSSNKSIHGSYGSGLSFNAGFDKITKKDWGWGIEVSYLLGNKIKADIKANTSGGSTYKLQIASKSNALFVTPLFFKNFEAREKIQPFVSAGLIMGAPRVVTEYSMQLKNANRPGETLLAKDRMTHRFTFGTKLAGGINVISGKKSIFFIDLEFNIMRPWQAKLKSLELRVNGDDMLSGMSDKQRTIVFEKEFDTTTGSGNREIADTTPFGSMGVRFGYKFLLR